jgi:hypothetical protein
MKQRESFDEMKAACPHERCYCKVPNDETYRTCEKCSDDAQDWENTQRWLASPDGIAWAESLPPQS